MLLLHGTGASTHSWRDVAPDLARDFRVIAVDLPGHGFTQLGSRRRSSLSAMAEDLWTLCETLSAAPSIFVGHSAGAAIALEMARRRDAPGKVIGLNAALGEFDGPAALLFPALAKALAAAPMVPRLVSAIAGTQSGVDRLLSATGSRIDDDGRRQYRTLVSRPEHVEGALEMMAQWSTRSLRDALPRLGLPVALMYADRDGTVPPKVSIDAVTVLENGSAISLGPLGHLAHEEEPHDVCARIREWLSR